MSRAKNLANNIMWSYVGTISTIIIGFAVRTVFIKTLGETMLGLNSLYASVIGVLSIAELGIGAILNTQLYKPVANGDTEEIIAIVQLYKKIYCFIAGIVLIFGLILIPFLGVFLNGAENIENVYVYYLFFLFNTIISYFSVYKFSVSNAEQKDYIEININTVFNLLMYIVQIIVLLVWKSYFTYLLVQLIVQFLKMVYTNLYMNHRYPQLKNSEKKKLTQETKTLIRKNVFAGVINKFADSAVNQTDNMIISAYVNVNTVGLVSNYTALRNYLERFSKPLLDNMGSIVGNFVNTESKERKCLLMKALQCYSTIIYGYLSLLLFFLSTPFIKIWIGQNFVLPENIILIISLNLMLSGVGDRPYVIFKNSHANFYNDWFVVLFSAIGNLVISICLAIPYGILGVLLGTSISILISVVWRPFIFYKEATGESVFIYFLRLIRNYLLVLGIGVFCHFIFDRLNYSNVFLEMLFKTIFLTLFFALAIIIVFIGKDEFNYICGILKNVLKRKKR